MDGNHSKRGGLDILTVQIIFRQGEIRFPFGADKKSVSEKERHTCTYVRATKASTGSAKNFLQLKTNLFSLLLNPEAKNYTSIIPHLW